MFERMAGLRCHKSLCNTTVTQTAFAACVRRRCSARIQLTREEIGGRAAADGACIARATSRAHAIHSVPTGTAKTLLSTAEPGATVKARG